MTHFVTKAPPINSIDSKCHTKKLKSSRTCLIGYSGFISLEWFLIAWERIHIPTSRTKQFQETRRAPAFGWRAPGLKTCYKRNGYEGWLFCWFLSPSCDKAIGTGPAGPAIAGAILQANQNSQLNFTVTNLF